MIALCVLLTPRYLIPNFEETLKLSVEMFRLAMNTAEQDYYASRETPEEISYLKFNTDWNLGIIVNKNF